MKNWKADTVKKGLRDAGAVNPYIHGFVLALLDQGYSIHSTQDYARSASHFGRWLDGCSIDISHLTDRDAERFARHRCGCPATVPEPRRRARLRRPRR